SGEGKQGHCNDGGLHQAICAVVNAGVSVVVAAGNQSTNADNRVPASFPEVITVSGITDSDGQPGGLGPKPCFGDRDDVFLNFSNFGASVDIAAPGGCIVSYNPAGGLETASGTSEASPHVAGAAAFFVGSQGSRPSPDQVRSWLLTQASRPQSTDGVGGDPDSGQSQSAATKKQIKKLKTFGDERGFFREIFRFNEPIFNEGVFKQWSHSRMIKDVVKAWHYHHVQYDWWYIPIGQVQTVLYDNRPESHTYKTKLVFNMGDSQRYGSGTHEVCVRIPPGVLHGCKVLSDEAHLFYITSETYNPQEEGRIPYDSDLVPHDWCQNALTVENDRRFFAPTSERKVLP
ncbi:MAG: hypothetical protein DCC75_04070, partial [Proteobacteria bacterium]